MRDPIRKLTVSPKKMPKSVLVVTNTARMLPRLEEIRALGYECTLLEAGGGAMDFLRAGKRANVAVLDLQAGSAEKLIRWITENRPGIRMVCVLSNSDHANFGPEAAALGAMVLEESGIEKVPEVLRGMLEPTNPLGL